MDSKSNYFKFLIIIGFIFAFHSAYAVAKSKFMFLYKLMRKDRNSFYGEQNNLDFYKFPIEVYVKQILNILYLFYR